jgi:O-antigen/teichoic acid export membrane protein
MIALEPLVRLALGIALIAWGLGVNGALIGFAGGTLLAFIAGTVLLWSVSVPREKAATETFRFQALDRYTWLVLVANVCLMTMASADQIAIRHFFSAEVAGQYAVAFVLGRVIVMTAISLGIIVFTRSAIMPPKDPGRPALLIKGLLATSGIAITATLGLMLAPKAIIDVIAGPAYENAQAFAGLLGVATTLFALSYVQTSYQISLKEMHVLWPLCVAAILEIALIWRFHDSVHQVLLILIGVMATLLIPVSLLSWRLMRTTAVHRGSSVASDFHLE